MKTWWENDEAWSRYAYEEIESEMTPFVLHALSNGTIACRGHREGTETRSCVEFFDSLKSLGFVMFQNESGFRFATNGALVAVTNLRKGVSHCRWLCADAATCTSVAELAAAWLTPIERTPEKPAVFCFSAEHGTYQVRQVGCVEGDFTRENYAPEVVEKFDRVVHELKKAEPAGRLVLMEGDPGTGKTHLIRSLVGALADHGRCIIVPPSLLDKLSGPEFVMCLIQQKALVSGANKAMTLILEDADDCLIAREQNAAAKASLSALLNLSDGIMGAALDLRVVATTNQELGAIDRAILRPGRLLERIHVGPLSPTHAERVLVRLGGAARSYEVPVTLAQVYEDARGK